MLNILWENGLEENRGSAAGDLAPDKLQLYKTGEQHRRRRSRDADVY